MDLQASKDANQMLIWFNASKAKTLTQYRRYLRSVLKIHFLEVGKTRLKVNESKHLNSYITMLIEENKLVLPKLWF
jgi:agmatine/peptidylarginine deiminase